MRLRFCSDSNLSKPQHCYLGEGGGGGRKPNGDINFCSDTQLWYPSFWSNNKLRYQSLSSETQLRLNKQSTFVERSGGDRQHNFGIMLSSEAQLRYQNLFIENKNWYQQIPIDFLNCRVKNTPHVRNMDAFRSCIWGLTYIAHVFKTHYDKLHDYALN